MRKTLLASVLGAGLAAASLGAQADIVIAVAAPMTGSEASFGEQMRRGAEMAVKDINAKGGVLGQKLVLETGDDACDPKQAVAVANQLAGKGVIFVAGHFCSGASIPASEVYAEEGILQISPGSTNPKFTERGLKNVFRVCGRDDQQGEIAAKYIAKNLPKAKVAILHDKTAYGKGLADQTKERLNALGIKEVMYEAYNKGDKDFTALVSKMKEAGVDLIYVGGYFNEAGLIIRQAKDQGLKATLMGGDALVSEEFWSITGPAGAGTLMTFSPDPRRNPATKSVVDEFLKQGFKPEGYTLYTYGAVQAFAQAAEKAKSTKLDDLVKVLQGGDKFDTVLGKINFDKKGDVNAPGYVVYVWKDGTYDYVSAKK